MVDIFACEGTERRKGEISQEAQTKILKSTTLSHNSSHAFAL